MSLSVPFRPVSAQAHRIVAIDGLRAFAVLAVVVFHIEPDWLPGGYLGVDLFFVISGFVVSASLAGRNSSYVAFLGARFYRLMPAAALTIGVTLIAFQLTGSGLLSDAHELSALFALTASSNFYFLNQNSYFDDALQGNPFLHFWSLSVEEQFYLLWPLVFVPFSRLPIWGKAIAVGGAVAGAYALFFRDADTAFFFMPARAYQFGLGAFAYAIHAQFWRDVSVPRSVLYVAAGMAFALFMQDGLHGKFVAGGLGPSLLFAVLVFCAARRPGDPVFSFVMMRLIGGASYSIYLVHWPIIVYAYILWPRSLGLQVFVIALSLMTGFALCHLVERPLHFRKRKRRQKRPRYYRSRALAAPILYATAFCCCVLPIMFSVQHAARDIEIALIGAAQKSLLFLLPSNSAFAGETAKSVPTKNGIASVTGIVRAHSGEAVGGGAHRPVRRSVQNADQVLASTRALTGSVNAKAVACTTFEAGRQRGEPSAKLLEDLDMSQCLNGFYLLFADSTGAAAAPFLAVNLRVSSIAQLNSAGCPFMLTDTRGDCALMNAQRLHLIEEKSQDYERIFLAFKWVGFGEDALEQLMTALGKAPAHFVLLTQLPSFTMMPEQLIAANKNAASDLGPWLEPDVVQMRDYLESVAAQYENIELLSWSPLDHAEGKLPGLTEEGAPIYADKYHYTASGIDWLIRHYLEHKPKQRRSDG